MEESKFIRDESYYLVSGWMINSLKLRGTQLQVYAIIHGFTQDGESWFAGTLRYLIEFTGASKRTVQYALESLVENGLIERRTDLTNGVPANKYRVVKTQLHPPCKNCTTPVQKLHPDNINNNINNNTKPTDLLESSNESSNKSSGSVLSPPFPPVDIPAGVQESFGQWLAYKRERKESYKPMGLKALEGQVRNNCAAYGARAVREIIQESMANGWKGIAWDRLKHRPNVIPPEPKTTNPFLAMLWEEEKKNGQG